MTDQFPLEIGADPEMVVAKSNDLVRGRHDFSTLEQRIFVAMVAQLNRETEFPVVEIPLGEVCELSGTDKSNLYREAQRLCDTLAGRTIGVHDRTNEEGIPRYTSYPCFRFCRHVKGTGVIQAKFSDELKPYLLQLKKKFTLYLLKVFLRLRSKYSTQIYELMKMRQGLSRLSMSVEEFRRKMGLEEKYSRFSSLRARVIDQAQEELREKADVYFTYRVVREGRTPKRLEFFVKENAEVIENLQKEVSSLEGEHGSSGPDSPGEPQDALAPSGEGPGSVDAKALFLSDRTQEEINALSGPDVDQLYEDAREAIESAHGDASDTYLESMTAQKMEALWEGG
jgi:plasmid replication initiation protein